MKHDKHQVPTLKECLEYLFPWSCYIVQAESLGTCTAPLAHSCSALY